jgi:hypothetical protein
MNKNIGFRRNIYRSWLDAAAMLATETNDSAQLRARLDPVVAARIGSQENRRMALDILVKIWGTSRETNLPLREEALALWRASTSIDDQLWLHYGLTLLQYPFFRLSAVAMGRMSQYTDTITPKDLKSRLSAELGQLGALDKAAERVIFSLRDWGILAPTEKRYTYELRRQAFRTEQKGLQLWLLAAALQAHPAEELPFSELVRLPELFPFCLTIGVQDVRESARFEVNRQGMSWDMVGLASHLNGLSIISG